MPKPKTAAKKVAPKFKDGQSVLFDMNGETHEGKIVNITGEGIEVKVGKTTYECEPDELTLVEAGDDAGNDDAPEEKPKGKKKDEDNDGDDAEEKPKGKAKGSGKSLASAFNSIPRLEGGGGGLPIGSWEVLVTDYDVAETDDKGTNAYIEMTGVNDADVEGTTGRKYYNLIDKDGNLQETGVGIFKNDLVTLGVDEDEIVVEDETFVNDVGAILKKLCKRGPWAAIKVVEAKKAGYTNIYINGLMPDQDEKPEDPNAK